MNSYSNITFRDKNPVKRWLQYRRMTTAVNLALSTQAQGVESFLDFGAGNGELIKVASAAYPKAHFYCYEPTPSLAEEAESNLSSIKNVKFFNSLDEITGRSFNLIFCLEVFEHLPNFESSQALQAIDSLLYPNGTAIFGVPVEIGIPALYKGLFRKSRRKDTFDTDTKNIFNSVIGLPPNQRQISEIAPGIAYYFEHMGFDYREFEIALRAKFKVVAKSFSPWNFGALMPEVYYVAQQKKK